VNDVVLSLIYPVNKLWLCLEKIYIEQGSGLLVLKLLKGDDVI
jgi:hypothetical protein